MTWGLVPMKVACLVLHSDNFVLFLVCRRIGPCKKYVSVLYNATVVSILSRIYVFKDVGG